MNTAQERKPARSYITLVKDENVSAIYSASEEPIVFYDAEGAAFTWADEEKDTATRLLGQAVWRTRQRKNTERKRQCNQT